MQTEFNLPENYEAPKSGGGAYTKFVSGAEATKLRILTSPVMGYEYWNTQNKPIRSKENWKVLPNDIKAGPDGKPGTVKYFWALKVWNHTTAQIELWEITQKGIISTLTAYHNDKDLGDLNTFDIKVTKTGANLTTEYSIVALPPKQLEEEVLNKAKETSVNLEALYCGDNPFTTPIDDVPFV